MLLLSVGFFAIITVFWSTREAGTSSKNLSSAAALSHDVFERCSSLDFAALPETTGFVAYTAANPAASGFVRELKIEKNPADPTTKTITLKVGWTESGNAKTQNFTMIKREDY